MQLRSILAAAALVGVVACGGDDDGTVAPRTTTSTAPATSTSASSSTSTTAGLEQPAIWPAADMLFRTPEAAARDFVATVLDVAPRLGAFQLGDSRSGEIPLLAPRGTGEADVVRSVLLLRQLGPQDGWFVLAAVQEQTSISEPSARAVVRAGPTRVRGHGRGFEGSLVIIAIRPGDARPLDRAVAIGGSMEIPEPFDVTLDLSSARPGETVVLLVRAATGHEEDPGELSALPVTIAG